MGGLVKGDVVVVPFPFSDMSRAKKLKKIREDMVKRKDLEALVDTVEILSNPAAMQAIKKSDRDIRQGRVKIITSVDDLLNE